MSDGRSPDRAELAIFDLDRTITRWPTYSAFLLFCALRLAPWRLATIPLLAPVAIGYATGLVSRTAMKEAMHALLIGRNVPRRKLNAAAAAFVEWTAARNLYPEALARIESERAAGRRILLATAAPEIYAAPLGGRLGAEDVIATRHKQSQRAIRHNIRGTNCHGPEKRRRIDEALRRAGVDRARSHIRFYSDDLSDLPTFEWVDEPIAVNPSRALASHAAQRGWAVLDWRKRARG